MNKQFIALALLIVASVASDAASIPIQQSITTDAPIIPVGEGTGLPKDDIPHQLGRPHVSRGHERRSLAEKMKAAQMQREQQPQQPQQQYVPSAPYEAQSSAPPEHGYAAQHMQQPQQQHAPPAPYETQPWAPGYPPQHMQQPQHQYGGYDLHGDGEHPSKPSHEAHFPQQFGGPMLAASAQTYGAMGHPSHGTAQYGGPVSNHRHRLFEQKLGTIIADKGLTAFYNDREPQRLQKVVEKLVSVDFNSISQQWGMSEEATYDLASLALYDIVFFCDDSGSMVFSEDGSRIDDLKLILSKVSHIAMQFDDDGISVRFMNSKVNADGIKSAYDLEELWKRVVFNGETPLGSQFQSKVLQPFVLRPALQGSLQKPVLAICITDGAPPAGEKIFFKNAIVSAKDILQGTRYGPGAFAIEIAQVGTDKKAEKYLTKELDKDPVIGHMVDVTSSFEMEQAQMAERGVPNMTPDMWLLKMCVGAIDSAYDEMDE